VHPAFDGPVILFQNIRYSTGRTPAILLQSLRGAGWFSPRKVFGEKALNRCCPRLADRRKSIVAPLNSTARYKYTHLPFLKAV
jgi:hypothetical protein